MRRKEENLEHSHAAVYRLAILAAVVLAALVLWLARERWLTLIGDTLIVEDARQPADVIHVIAGDDYRTDYAVRLYKQGEAQAIFFSGGWCTTHGYYHGQHGRDRSLAEGVPLQAIGMDDAPV